MNGGDQEVYNKCLFRTVCISELKSEMHLRNVTYSPSDSFYILTLKLRREILLKSEHQTLLVKRLDEEIAAHDASKHTVGSRYKCSLVGCSFSCTNHNKYLVHLEFVHHNSKSRLACQFKHSCYRDFPSISMLKSHVKDVHKKRVSPVEIRQNQLVERLIRLSCVEVSCGYQKVSCLADLKAHMYTHTDKKDSVQ